MKSFMPVEIVLSVQNCGTLITWMCCVSHFVVDSYVVMFNIINVKLNENVELTFSVSF